LIEDNDLQLAKDFIELSILMSPKKQFIPPDYDKENKAYVLLHKAILELKRDGLINVGLSAEGGMIINLNR